jgi:hypothetical protein
MPGKGVVMKAFLDRMAEGSKMRVFELRNKWTFRQKVRRVTAGGGRDKANDPSTCRLKRDGIHHAASLIRALLQKYLQHAFDEFGGSFKFRNRTAK